MNASKTKNDGENQQGVGVGRGGVDKTIFLNKGEIKDTKTSLNLNELINLEIRITFLMLSG